MKWSVLVLACAGCELIANIPSPSSSSMTDGGPIAQTCTSDPDCSAPTPLCLVEDEVCVECKLDAHCSASAPVCGLGTYACRGCLTDIECPSNVCLFDGTCADPARFVYAAAAGTGVACSSAMPCSVDEAITHLSPTTDIVKLAPGTYLRTIGVVLTQPGIIAGAGSTFSATGGMGFTAIAAEGVKVDILGLSVALGTTAHGAFRCALAGGGLRIVRAAATGGAYGLTSSDCAVELDRVKFAGAAFHGISASGGTLAIRNSYLTGNGSSASSANGGVVLAGVTAGTIEHSTIANNLSASAGGIKCTGSETVAMRSNIVAGNTAPGIEGPCSVSYSVVDPGFVGGPNNMAVDPGFVSPGANDFHLLPTSPARGLGDPAGALRHDSDDQPRPQPAGSPPDPGADEIP